MMNALKTINVESVMETNDKGVSGSLSLKRSLTNNNLLSLKRLVLRLIEVLGHDLFGEALRVEDLEGLTSWQPTHHIIETHGCSVGQHRMQLHGESG
jgi:hypothetical protein